MKQLIKKILIQEVNKKYSKPTPSVEKLIYNWLDNYISGAQMYHEKHYEFNYGFEWCNDGMEIMSFDLAFEYIDEYHSDKVKNSERNFDRGTLQIPKDIIQEMLTDIPVRKNYLIYVIEEWFEDTLLDEVSTMIGRDDISIDEFEEYPETSLVCVPPQTKPEGITDDQMIDYIVSNTLHRKEHLERSMLEDPDFDLEKSYLNILKMGESKRLRGR